MKPSSTIISDLKAKILEEDRSIARIPKELLGDDGKGVAFIECVDNLRIALLDTILEQINPERIKTEKEFEAVAVVIGIKYSELMRETLLSILLY